MSEQKPQIVKKTMTRKTRRRWSIGLRWAIAVLLMFFSAFPIIWIISASFNPTSSLATQSLIPPNASLDNYKALFNSPNFPFAIWFWNTIKVTTITTVLGLSPLVLMPGAGTELYRGLGAVVMFVVIWLFLDETNQHRYPEATRLKPMLRTFGGLMASRKRCTGSLSPSVTACRRS